MTTPGILLTSILSAPKTFKSDYLGWKWAQATTTDGKQLGIPSDIGPTALFYRADIFEQAKLPSDPDQVATQMTTWDAFIEFGTKLLAAKNEDLPSA